MGWSRGVAFLALALAGCAIAPQPVVAPSLSEGSFGGLVGWAATWGPSRARIADDTGATQRLSGNGDNVQGVPAIGIPTFIPVVVRGRVSPLPRLEASGYLGWTGDGGGLRLRLSDDEASLKVFVAADGEVGFAYAADDRRNGVPLPYAGRLAVEVSVPASRRTEILGALGVSAGRRRHGVDVGSTMEQLGVDNVSSGAHLAIVRPEVRLEGALGGALMGKYVGVEVAVAPYLVLATGTPRSSCVLCSRPTTLASFSQTWGLAVIVQVLGRSASGVL